MVCVTGFFRVLVFFQQNSVPHFGVPVLTHCAILDIVGGLEVRGERNVILQRIFGFCLSCYCIYLPKLRSYVRQDMNAKIV